MAVETIIAQSLKKSYSYEEYNNLVAGLVEKNSSTSGSNPELAQYTKLNATRSNRIDKTIEIDPQSEAFFKQVNKKFNWVVITESWCADAAQIVPVLHKIAALNPHFNLRLVLRDQNEELMNKFLTNGAKSIPMLIITDETCRVLKVWGPRPSVANAMVEAYKAQYGKLTVEFKTDLQRWYNADKGQTIVADLVKILDEI